MGKALSCYTEFCSTAHIEHGVFTLQIFATHNSNSYRVSGAKQHDGTATAMGRALRHTCQCVLVGGRDSYASSNEPSWSAGFGNDKPSFGQDCQFLPLK